MQQKGHDVESVEKFFSAKGLIDFFFSYDGRINRLQYFGGVLFCSFVIAFVPNLNELVGDIIFILYLYILLGFVQKRSRDMGETGTKYIVAMLFGYFAAIFKATVSGFDGDSIWGILVALPIIASGVANLCLIFCRGVENPDMNKRSKLTKRPVLLTVAVVIMSFVSLVGVNYFYNGNDELKKATIAAGALYRHTIVYNDVCREYGVKLTKYPNVFKDELKNEIKVIENVLKKNGMSLEYVYDGINSNYGKMTRQLVREELNDIRIAFILGVVSKDQGVSLDEIIWDDEFYNIASLQDACVLFDETSINESNEGLKLIKQMVREIVEPVKEK